MTEETVDGLADCVDRFWQGVYLTLLIVFNTSAQLAERYRHQFELTPTRRLMLAYNSTPLQVATDLSQLDEATVEQVQLYRDRVMPLLNGVQSRSDGDRFSMKIA